MDILQTLRELLMPKEKTGETAKNRLKSMLVIDRANVSPEIMEAIKDDIIGVYQKYFEINDQDMEVRFDNNQNTVVLTTSISVLRVRREIAARNEASRNKSYSSHNRNKK